MSKLRLMVAFFMTLLALVPSSLFASSHREAPITALDRTADITDWYTFVSYDHPNRVTMILNVDPFLEPSNPYRINIPVSNTSFTSFFSSSPHNSKPGIPIYCLTI